MYWSVDSGPVHLVATAGVLGFEPGTAQYRWLEADLAAAAAPTQRAARPWIILTDHYPFYCSLKSCNTPPTAAAAAAHAAAPQAGAPPAAAIPPCAKEKCEDCPTCTPPYRNRSFCPTDPTVNQCAKWTHQHAPCPPCKPAPPPVRRRRVRRCVPCLRPQPAASDLRVLTRGR